MATIQHLTGAPVQNAVANAAAAPQVRMCIHAYVHMQTRVPSSMRLVLQISRLHTWLHRHCLLLMRHPLSVTWDIHACTLASNYHLVQAANVVRGDHEGAQQAEPAAEGAATQLAQVQAQAQRIRALAARLRGPAAHADRARAAQVDQSIMHIHPDL